MSGAVSTPAVRSLALLFAIACGLARPSAAQVPLTAQVYIGARQAGQGILRARGSECFVLTPLHVVERAQGPIAVVGDVAIRAQSQLERGLTSDLAVLRINADAKLACPAWAASIDVDRLIAGQGTGYLLSREADGSLSRMPVVLRATDADSIYVRPADAADQIAQTMSGSSLVVGGAIVGLLQVVKDNEGRVY